VLMSGTARPRITVMIKICCHMSSIVSSLGSQGGMQAALIHLVRNFSEIECFVNSIGACYCSEHVALPHLCQLH
jgi:hypothetical protein